PSSAAAQDEARLRKIERELRALQRAGFPGGDGRYFTPEVDTSRPQTPQQTVGTPSSSALTDVLTQLEALETQLARPAARGEENANEISQLETRLNDARAGASQADPAQPSGIIQVPTDASPSAAAPAAAGAQRPAALTPAASAAR